MSERAPGATTRRRRMLDAVDERLGLKSLQYPVPEHANNLAWSLGGLTAATLAILIVTGVVLTQFYDPTPEAANASVREIVTDVWAGRFIRGVHYWSAQAMYVLAILHLVRVFVTASYKRPREGNWLIGVTMLALTIAAIFTGTVLKWDQEGFEALGHNLELARLLGGAGFWFTDTFSAGVPLLVRLYVAHVAIVPGLLVGLFVIHAALIRRHGISPSPAVPDEPGEVREPFTHHLRRVGALALILFAVVGVLAILRPPGVGPTPIEGIEVTKPPWMFWWVFTLENKLGLQGILYGTGVLFAILYAVPFVDRNTNRSWRQRPVAMTLAGLVVAALVILTIMEALTSPASHLG